MNSRLPDNLSPSILKENRYSSLATDCYLLWSKHEEVIKNIEMRPDRFDSNMQSSVTIYKCVTMRNMPFSSLNAHKGRCITSLLNSLLVLISLTSFAAISSSWKEHLWEPTIAFTYQRLYGKQIWIVVTGQSQSSDFMKIKRYIYLVGFLYGDGDGEGNARHIKDHTNYKNLNCWRNYFLKLFDQENDF